MSDASPLGVVIRVAVMLDELAIEYVLGNSLLDRRQLERRIQIAVPGAPAGLWVTSPEDQVLRKLDWFRAGGEVSDQQWRDIAGILRVSGDELDLEYLEMTAEALGLRRLLDRALHQGPGSGAGSVSGRP